MEESGARIAVGEDVAITSWLAEWGAGDAAAREAVLQEVLPALRAQAAAYLRRERVDHTLQPTALVNELYLRLAGRHKLVWENRSQFFGFAARTMRHILVDHARRHKSARRGSGAPTISLSEDLAQPEENRVDLLDLDRALEELTQLDPEQARLVDLRFFAGLAVEEIVELSGLSPATVHRRLASARAWLHRRLAASA